MMAMNPTAVINKTMDLKDLAAAEAKTIIEELNVLIMALRAKNMQISSWYGKFNISGDPVEKINRGYDYQPLENAVDDSNFPWFLYWEIAWVYLNNDFRPDHKVLDLGGSSSLFSYYLASKGISVTTIDLQPDLVENANYVARQMDWDLKNYVMDMRKITLNEIFDHITSICVYEHIPLYARVQINYRIKELLVDNGKFSITFDYRNPSGAARISSPKDISEQFVIPSGLKLRGNEDFYDNGINYLLHPFYYRKFLWKVKVKGILEKHFRPGDFFKTKNENDYTFGALFLEKVSTQ